jgi:hypothetical protein
MLRHNPQLRKAWERTRKIEEGSLLHLDMKYPENKSFLKKFLKHILREEPLSREERGRV